MADQREKETTPSAFTPGEWEALRTHFGEETAWAVRAGLSRYGKRWGLHGLRFIPYYSVNVLFAGRSVEYGDVVLKLGRPCREMFTECRALREYNGRRFCRLYESEPEHGALLLERLQPGTPLRAVEAPQERWEIFCRVYTGLHILAADNTRYPTYSEWVEKAAHTMRRLAVFPALSLAMERAQALCRPLWERYPDRLLLHGDLHHDNILHCADGRYRVIDPKGVIGPTLFDLPRFLRNEPYAAFPHPEEHLWAAVDFLAGRTGYPPADVARSFYVDTVMGLCWSVEDGAPAGEYPAMEETARLAASLLAMYEIQDS